MYLVNLSVSKIQGFIQRFPRNNPFLTVDYFTWIYVCLWNSANYICRIVQAQSIESDSFLNSKIIPWWYHSLFMLEWNCMSMRKSRATSFFDHRFKPISKTPQRALEGLINFLSPKTWKSKPETYYETEKSLWQIKIELFVVFSHLKVTFCISGRYADSLRAQIQININQCIPIYTNILV